MDTVAAELSTNPVRWADFKLAVAEYLYDVNTAKILNALWNANYAPDDAIAFVRERGARTQNERREAWQAKLAGWQAQRDAKDTVTADQVRAQIAAAILKVLAKLETKTLAPDALELVAGVKRQVLGGS